MEEGRLGKASPNRKPVSRERESAKQEQLKAVKGGDQCGGYKKEFYDMSHSQGAGSMKP